MDHLRDLRKRGSTATAALICALTVVVVMKENDWRRASWWEPGSVGQWIFVVLSIATALASFYVSVALWRILGRKDRSSEFAKAAHAIARLIEEKTSLRHGEFGINVWLVKGPTGFRLLDRVCEAMVAPERTETPITWTKGKGIIGEAWARKTSRFADLDTVRAAIPSARVFCRIRPEERFRLTWAEFNETSRYHAVLAVPLRQHRFARHAVRGVVAIDVLVPGKGLQIDGIQQLPEFDAIRRTCENALAGD
jgi:hypothetical protein